MKNTANTMSIEVRKLSQGELSLANAFFNRIYATERSFSDFEWEFANGPAGPAIYIGAIDTAIKDEIKIVGIQCAIPLKMLAPNDEEILTAKSEDTLVDPDYRGQGIFNKMYQLLFEECKNLGVKYIWGFTPAYKAFVRVGFKVHFKSRQLLFVQNPLTAFQYLVQLNPKNRFIDKFKIMGLCLLSKVLTIKANLHNQRKKITLSSDARFEFKIESPLHRKLLCLNETHEYIKWRIIENPHNNYRSVVFSNSDNETVANMIVSNRTTVGYIERMIFSRSLSNSEKREIIAHCITTLEELKQAPLIRFLGFDGNEINKNEIKLLLEIGFFKVDRGTWFIWKSLDENYDHQPEDVFLNRLFSQGVI